MAREPRVRVQITEAADGTIIVGNNPKKITRRRWTEAELTRLAELAQENRERKSRRYNYLDGPYGRLVEFARETGRTLDAVYSKASKLAHHSYARKIKKPAWKGEGKPPRKLR